MASQQTKQFERAKKREQIIKIYDGYELSLKVSTDISCGLSFMNAAYRQAEKAVLEIVKQTRQFHKRYDVLQRNGLAQVQLDNLLFSYSGNAIAFVGTRGGGKTRTMLSFAECLSKNQKCEDCLATGGKCVCNTNDDSEQKRNMTSIENSEFVVCTPISPATIDSEQGILYVVLSRLYRLVEELLDQDVYCRRISERDKSELYSAFRQCLSGIEAVKGKQKDLSDFHALKEIGDGLSLQGQFHKLVQTILKIAADKKDFGSRYLVVQLDDTDSQGQNTYAVFEDVRKYLLIPNLIILISADMEITHSLILEKHLEQYEHVLKTLKKDQLEDELNRATRKYIDKLIPPSHMVYLPQMDKTIAGLTDKLVLQYVNGKDEPVFNWMKKSEQWYLQDFILSLIYRKTGILFVAPSAYLHNIIPRTMRGLNQLLYFLKEMAHDLEPLKEEDFINSAVFARAILRQCTIAEDNLSQFTKYFTDTWCKAKLRHVEDAEFMKRLCETAPINWVRLEVRYLLKRYSVEEDKYQAYTRYELDQLMAEIEKVHRSEDDFFLMFAIRTLFTLESHRRIWWQKGVQAEQWLNETHAAGDKLFFDYKLEQIQTRDVLPCADKYHVGVQMEIGTPAEKLKDSNGLVFELQFRQPVRPNFYIQLPWYSQKVLFCSGNDGRNVDFNVFNCFNLPLRLEELKKQRIVRTGQWIELTLKQAYWVQELVLLIVANWDVQAKLYRATDLLERTKMLDAERVLSQKITYVVDGAYDIIQQMNSGKIEAVAPELWAVLDKDSTIRQRLKDLMFEAVDDFETLKSILSEHITFDRADELLAEYMEATSEHGVLDTPEENVPIDSTHDTTEEFFDVEAQDQIHDIEVMIEELENDIAVASNLLRIAKTSDDETVRLETSDLQRLMYNLSRRLYTRKKKIIDAEQKPQEQRTKIAKKVLEGIEKDRQEFLIVRNRLDKLSPKN